ncbi:MAG: orotidine-5'-phosphate decarboxylase [Methanomassiliicoccus sp.]|nr:MAG: orotidine-5'-phosphate decarboxylase [Methanomassiliicoccus sp.]
MKPFADRIMDAIDGKQNPTCVGLDPRFDMMPGFLKEECQAKYGENFEAIGECFLEFNRAIIDAVKDHVAVVKPQAAYYEAYGAAGIGALQETVEYAMNKGLLVIIDAKRNDIGPTAEMYSRTYLGKVDSWSGPTPCFDVDALTVSPYLGRDGIDPFINDCMAYGKGIFVLVKTSNPSSIDFQDIPTIFEHPDNDTIVADQAVAPAYVGVAERVRSWGKEVMGDRNYSSIGAVVGATFPHEAEKLRKLMPASFFLVPGYGAQGGTASDVMNCFDEDGFGAIVSSSRGIIYADRSDKCAGRYAEGDYSLAAADAAIAMRNDIINAMRSCGKYPW